MEEEEEAIGESSSTNHQLRADVDTLRAVLGFMLDVFRYAGDGSYSGDLGRWASDAEQLLLEAKADPRLLEIGAIQWRRRRRRRSRSRSRSRRSKKSVPFRLGTAEGAYSVCSLATAEEEAEEDKAEAGAGEGAGAGAGAGAEEEEEEEDEEVCVNDDRNDIASRVRSIASRVRNYIASRVRSMRVRFANILSKKRTVLHVWERTADQNEYSEQNEDWKNENLSKLCWLCSLSTAEEVAAAAEYVPFTLDKAEAAAEEEEEEDEEVRVNDDRDDIASRVRSMRKRFVDILSKKRRVLHVWESTADQNEYSEQNEDWKNQDLSKLCWLLRCNSDHLVVPLVGVAKAGKTTLARQVYDHEMAADWFKLKAWVDVGKGGFDLVKVTKEVAESLTGKHLDLDSISALQEMLVKELQLLRSRFLVVVDDVWIEDGRIWQTFMIPFTSAATLWGSRVLVTTRDQTVADIMRPKYSCTLECLLKNDCSFLWQKFNHICLMELQNRCKGIRATLEDAMDREIRQDYLIRCYCNLRSFLYDAEDDILEPLDYMLKDLTRMYRNSVEEREANFPNNASEEEEEEAGYFSPQPRSSKQSEEKMLGRKEELDELAGLLLSTDDDGPTTSRYSPVKVIAVVGMAGIGKTTLVKHLYNDPRVISHFHGLMGWVHVAHEDDLVKLTRSAVESFTEGESVDSTQLDQLKVHLQNAVKGRRFLLVLDDLRDALASTFMFNQSLRPLIYGATGSKVLITTRDQGVAYAADAIQPLYKLGYLSEESCWSLFKIHAFGGREPAQELLESYKTIVRKCGRLPLAVKNAALLSCKESQDSKPQEHHTSKTGKNEDPVQHTLRSSYQNLPCYMKHCFTYCSVFPKGHIIPKDHLIQLWMAQGLIKRPFHMLDVEVVAMCCIDELLSRSILQHVLNDKGEVDETSVTMHDLFHNLARSLTEEECQSWTIERCESSNHSTVVRHASILATSDRNVVNFSSFDRTDRLRSLLFLANDWPAPIEIQTFKHFRCLRALDLSAFFMKEMPVDSISNLKLLRYLNLSGTGIRVLPKSICGLHYLQTLDLSCTEIRKLPKSICKLELLRNLYVQNSRKLKFLPESISKLKNLQLLDLSYTCIINKLPDSIGRMVSLRRLHLQGNKIKMLPKSIGELYLLQKLSFSDTNIKELPKGIGRLTSLQGLTEFHVATNEEHAGIEELRDLNDICGKLHIKQLCNVASVTDVRSAEMEHKKSIESLRLDWSGYWSMGVSTLDKEVLEALKPHTRLGEMEILWYGAEEFPCWMADKSFTRLVRIEVSCCPWCEVLPNFEQLPSLKTLEVKSMMSLQKIVHKFDGCGSENYSSSSKSHSYALDIVDCPELTSLHASAFTLLHVEDCDKLDSVDFSGEFPYQVELNLQDVPQLNFSGDTYLPSKLKRVEVRQCPQLKEWCMEHRDGKLAHVQNVVLDRVPFMKQPKTRYIEAGRDGMEIVGECP